MGWVTQIFPNISGLATPFRILGLATPWTKFHWGGWGVSWTLVLHNFMKICKNAENVSHGLWILLHPNTICANIFLILRPSGNLQVQKFGPQEEVEKRHLTSNLMVKSLQIFNRGDSASHARSGYFIEVWVEFVPLSTMAALKTF